MVTETLTVYNTLGFVHVWKKLQLHKPGGRNFRNINLLIYIVHWLYSIKAIIWQYFSFLILNIYKTWYNETRHLYQECYKNDAICRLLIRCVISLFLLASSDHHIISPYDFKDCRQVTINTSHFCHVLIIFHFHYEMPWYGCSQIFTYKFKADYLLLVTQIIIK